VRAALVGAEVEEEGPGPGLVRVAAVPGVCQAAEAQVQAVPALVAAEELGHRVRAAAFGKVAGVLEPAAAAWAQAEVLAAGRAVVLVPEALAGPVAGAQLRVEGEGLEPAVDLELVPGAAQEPAEVEVGGGEQLARGRAAGPALEVEVRELAEAVQDLAVPESAEVAQDLAEEVARESEALEQEAELVAGESQKLRPESG